MGFPSTRPRRLRQSSALREALAETHLTPKNLIIPLFVRPGRGQKHPIDSMPGQAQLSIDLMIQEARRLQKKGVFGVLLFGIPSRKNAQGSEAWATGGIIQQAVRALKKSVPGLFVTTDLCFCEYTTHGHCGILRRTRVRNSGIPPFRTRGISSSRHVVDLDNDATLKNIARTAVAQARAGADMVAPSGMIDGMVGTIRQALDRAGFQKTLIMSYAAKYASAFYGPFREAAGSTPQFGDRRGYQMNPTNAEEALREVALDVQEGADIIMVKPALAYLDIIRRVKDQFHVPVAAYNVSGEYSMVKAAAQKGWIEEKRMVGEILTGIRRAGADLIITYHINDITAENQRGGKP